MINPRTKQRELAYVVKIDNIEPIIGSDNCEAAIVGGWKVMVRKNTFNPGDYAVYFEIDSKVPEIEIYSFLKAKHYKIKTQKYTFGGKGNFISQGLLMHFNDFYDNSGKIPTWQFEFNNLIINNINPLEEGFFLTNILEVKYSIVDDNKRKSNINKYLRMKQRNAKLFEKYKFLNKLYRKKWGKKLLFIFLGNRRDARASYWPEWVVKTDEERVQNLPQLFPGDDTEWFVTEKIDGSSTTFTMKRNKIKRNEFYVCSRNVCFDKPNKQCFYETNIYTEMAEKYNIEQVLKDILIRNPDFKFITIQGETYGETVQKKTYGIHGRDFKAFNLIVGRKDEQTKRLNPKEMTEFLIPYGIPCVPILDEHFKLPNSIDEMVEYADGISVVDQGTIREGVVLRTYDGVNSFKSVSNKYLIEKGE